MMKWIVIILCAYLIKAEELYEVICPAFREHEINVKNPSLPFSFRRPTISYSYNEYCQCSLSEHGTSKTAILKCDFEFQKDILLTESLFSFGTLNVTSAYVRMTNARSAILSSKFLASWMDSPSSALDIWHCGSVVIKPTPTPHPLQLNTDIKTFVGVGIINCTLGKLPSLFLRDRSRGALRVKNCAVGTIEAGLFHNIDEIRYMNFENTVVGEVAGPLSSSGVITLSKKEIHTWDGIVFLNSTFKMVAPFAFNVTHKDLTEKFIIRESTFGRVNRGGISATGDIDVLMTNSSFESLDSFAIQVSVNGKMCFSRNVIKTYVSDSLMGLNCTQVNSTTLDDNTLHVSLAPPEDEDVLALQFMVACGKPKVSYVVSSRESASRQSTPAVTSSVVTCVILVLGFFTGGILTWACKNRTLFRYHYQRNDIPLFSEERNLETEDETRSSSNDTTKTNLGG